ncbi:unnamed protein product [Vicia faba]|uniref:Uncharacterized protein n=1 Tax=Vicia faba TaxID=3906 RepID=A0AAV0ZDD4_VICFA|nr:unnamed protein product [Vicia faba]
MVLIRMSNSMMKKVKLSDSLTASTLQTLSLIPGLLGFKIPSLENKNLLDGDINNWNLHGCYNSSEFGYNTSCLKLSMKNKKCSYVSKIKMDENPNNILRPGRPSRLPPLGVSELSSLLGVEDGEQESEEVKVQAQIVHDTPVARLRAIMGKTNPGYPGGPSYTSL